MLGPEVIKVFIKATTPASVGELIRKKFVSGMRYGKTVCLDFDRTAPDFTAYAEEGTFDPYIFFDWYRFNRKATYMEYVREDENHQIGGINPGYYERSSDFNMCMRTNKSTEAEIKSLV